MTERGRLSRSLKHPRLGAYLGALIVLFALTGLAGVLYVHARSNSDARRQALSQASLAARSGARLLAEDLGVVSPTLAGMAANPATAKGILAHPSGCQLTFSAGAAVTGHLDILRPDGSVACSSLKGGRSDYA
ncbi:MAG: hypothetical protein ACYDC2_10625, partial [Solirubrobacteraceae bacterium]